MSLKTSQVLFVMVPVPLVISLVIKFARTRLQVRGDEPVVKEFLTRVSSWEGHLVHHETIGMEEHSASAVKTAIFNYAMGIQSKKDVSTLRETIMALTARPAPAPARLRPCGPWPADPLNTTAAALSGRRGHGGYGGDLGFSRGVVGRQRVVGRSSTFCTRFNRYQHSGSGFRE